MEVTTRTGQFDMEDDGPRLKGEVMATPEAALRILNDVNKHYDKPAVAARLTEAIKKAERTPEAYMLEVIPVSIDITLEALELYSYQKHEGYMRWLDGLNKLGSSHKGVQEAIVAYRSRFAPTPAPAKKNVKSEGKQMERQASSSE